MKAENLKRLKKHNFNVPNFEIIAWEDRDKKIDISNFNGLYAIRSSCELEDSELDSFAGQFDTYLNVKKEDINKRVKDCFNSVNNKNIKDYLKSKNLSVEDIKMDVIVQEMVDSEYSGVIFTANPQGLLNETVIVVGKGLGNNVVEDKIDTTTYYYNLTDKVYYYEGKEELLNNELVEKVINISNEIKEKFGEYIDIEYAISNNIIYILQVRPITTLNTDNIVILDNSNIVESYPGISLPLTISFVEKVYSDIFKKLSYRVTKNKKLITNNSDYFNNMVGHVNGRLYYKVSNWYGLLETLPFHKKIIPIWQDMLGIKNINYDKNQIKITKINRIISSFNIVKELITVTKNMEYLNNKFIEVNTKFNDRFSEELSNEEIIKIYREVKKDLLDIWDITLINDLYSFINTGLLKNRLKKKKYSNEKINDYISGISNIESLKPINSLISTAYDKDKLSKEEYEKQFNKYIEFYGDRNLEELKLESKTFRTNPELLDSKIKDYRSDLNKLETIYNNISNHKDININGDLITKYLSKKAMIGIKNREISRLNRCRIYGMVRSMMIAIGKNLVKENKIHNYRDIFYLKIEEVFDNNHNFEDIIKNRKEDYHGYSSLPTYSRLIFAGQEFDKKNNNITRNRKEIITDKLLGTPTSNGIVEAEALVITDINKRYDTKDKILITKMTDPGWVFLISNAKGIISEKGSILSHTAIIARELKIPAIVGVEEATTCIKTGDYLKMDASSGKIEILKRSNK